MTLALVIRATNLTNQVLLNDEWHGLLQAGTKSLWTLLTEFDSAFSSNAYNAYCRVLLHTLGWNETWLRLPALVCGVLLVGAPWLVRQRLPLGVTILWSLLLALSPVLIMHSRNARSYTPFALLTTVSLMAAYRWLRAREPGERRMLWLYLGSGALACLWHLWAVVAVFACAALATVLAFWPTLALLERRPRRAHLISMWLCPASGIVLPLSSLLSNVAARKGSIHLGDVSLRTYANALTTFVGSANWGFVLVALCLALVGYVVLWRSDRLAALVIAAVAGAYLTGFLVFRPLGLHNPPTTVRYCIALLPLFLLLVSISLAPFCRPPRSVIKAAALCGVLLATWFLGPWSFLLGRVNNLTHHHAFHSAYAEPDPEQAFVDPKEWVHLPIRMNRARMPHAYDALAQAEPLSAIEYPWFVGNSFNIYYYYQHFHQQELMAGYLLYPVYPVYPGPWFQAPTPGKPSYGRAGIERAFGNTTIGSVLSRVPDAARQPWDTMVYLGDADAIRRSGADVLILHKNLVAEMFLVDDQPTMSEVDYLVATLTPELGAPIFLDHWVVVFSLAAD